MNQRTDRQQEKFELLKAARSALRLKHALRADRECNDVLPVLEKAIDKAISAGEVYELPIASLLEEAA